MAFRGLFAKLSPWAAITIGGCAVLFVVDAWRELGATSFPLIRGTLPNLVAVPTLTFGFLMFRFPERRPSDPMCAASQDRLFWFLWLGSFLATVAWEFSQLWGALLFDPLDLVATGVGAIATVIAFMSLRRFSFLPSS